MFDKRLIRKINNGRCFVLVGSGPSCEVGYPSWQRLAELTYAELQKRGRVSDPNSYEKYLEDRKYPELFRQAERDLGDRLALINIIKSLLTPPGENSGILYKLLSKWPFACYLTTNYDDEIANYISELGEHFTVIRNRPEDFYSIRDGVSHLVQKLHSDLNHPDEVVLTSVDYNRFYVEDSGQYFRDKLRQIFEMFDVFIVGHSLSDPDIKYVLQLARKTASPQHPIYMAAADFTQAEEKEYFEKYNIVLVRYSNDDGKHSQLRRLLQTVDKFIVPRTVRKERTGTVTISEEEIEITTALFLHRKLHGQQSKDYLSPIILSSLFSIGGQNVSREKLNDLPVLRTLSAKGVAFNEAIDESLDILLNQGLIIDSDGEIALTIRGKERVQEYRSIRKTEKDQAYGQFRLTLKKVCNEINDSQLDKCQLLAERAIVDSFASRGLAIANQVFAQQSANHEDLSDIFGYVSNVAGELDGMEVRAAFVEAMHQFLIEPNPPQRAYLASISQGFFLYHHLGLDPKCSQLRQDIFHRTLWLFDSSVLLPLVAVGCHNHDYASELFQMLNEAGAVQCTTPRLLQEAWEHLQWAVNFVETNGVESPEFVRATLVKGSYKQNLFLDGYIRLSAEGRVGSFKDYLESILPRGNDRSSFESYVSQAGLYIVSISDLEGFEQEDWGEIEEAKELIQRRREYHGTFRSTLQIESEAEIWVIIKNLRSGKYSLPTLGEEIERVYFVSQSRVLDQVFQPEGVSTWTPEAVYRYVTSLPGKHTNPDLLQQCMLHEYYYAGVSFIDKDRYVRFFGPSIDAAKLSYEKEKSKYIAEIEDTYVGQIDEAFEKTPDLEKPFFVAQMGWRVAESSKRRQEIAMQRAREAEAKVKQLEAEKDRAWKIREKRRQEQEAARLRNLQDPKHVRKRLRQAKKRRKKKKRK